MVVGSTVEDFFPRCGEATFCHIPAYSAAASVGYSAFGWDLNWGVRFRPEYVLPRKLDYSSLTILSSTGDQARRYAFRV